MNETPEASYIDYDTFLDPDFSPSSFANTLVLATNNPSESPIDINTPLSRVLFDVQDIDTRIDTLTSKSALPLLQRTRNDVNAGSKITQVLDTQVSTLVEAFQRLQKEVIEHHATADEVRVVSERVWQTVKLGRSVGRCLIIGRQLETQMGEFQNDRPGGKREEHTLMVRGANSVLALRQVFAAARFSGEAEGLDRIAVMRALRGEIVDPAEEQLLARAEQTVSQFSMSSLTASDGEPALSSTIGASQPQSEDTKSRATSALVTLYLLSPLPSSEFSGVFEPLKLISSLQEYLRRGITSSLAGMAAGLITLPKLERTLSEVSARCQNIVALEMLLESTKPPFHPVVIDSTLHGQEQIVSAARLAAPHNLLQPLLDSLDTGSLPSYFWRSMASQLSNRVQKIVRDGGVSARTLRTNRDRVAEVIKECVNKGSQLPATSLSKGRSTVVQNWEREAAVMVRSIMAPLGR